MNAPIRDDPKVRDWIDRARAAKVLDRAAANAPRAYGALPPIRRENA